MDNDHLLHVLGVAQRVQHSTDLLDVFYTDMFASSAIQKVSKQSLPPYFIFRDSLGRKCFLYFPRGKVPDTELSELLDVLDVLGCDRGWIP